MLIPDNTIIDERYRIISYIASGGMADIYQAIDLINKTEVAIKIIKEENISIETNLKQFQNELIIAANLNHQNIVKVLNQGLYNKIPYLAQELMLGKDVKSILDLRSSFSLNEAIDFMLQVLLALIYSHSHNVLHCDIKPDNLFLLPDGTIKLGDFGIAAIKSFQKDIEQKVYGSVNYLAPEIFTGSNPSIKSDIYSCGITFFELITGRTPFNGSSVKEIGMAHLKEAIPSVNKYVSNVPKDIDKIIQKACAKNPKNRFNNVKEFYDALLYYKNHQSIEKKGLFKRLLCKD